MSIGSSCGVTRKQFLLSLLGGLAGTSCRQARNNLALELQQRYESDGLALLRIRSNWIETISGGGNSLTRNPKDDSLPWFSARGDFVAWWIRNSVNLVRPCSGSIAVTTRDGRLLWQLPGGFRAGRNRIQTLGLSDDGRRVALYAFHVSDPGAPHLPEQAELSLQLIDSTDMKIVQIGEPSRDQDVGSISWEPDGNSFVFDRAGKVFIYDLSSHRASAIADGSDPTWFPDGKHIAFRTGEGKAVAIDRATLEVRKMLGGRKVLSPIQWSPDSKYVVATEPASILEKLWYLDPTVTAVTRVYRLNDMASVAHPINMDNFDALGRWWFWILDYPGFVRGAEADLPLHCGPQ